MILVTKTNTGLATTKADTANRRISRITNGGNPAGSGRKVSINPKTAAPRL